MTLFQAVHNFSAKKVALNLADNMRVGISAKKVAIDSVTVQLAEALLHRNDGVEDEVAFGRGVAEAVGVAFRAVEAVARAYRSGGFLRRSRLASVTRLASRRNLHDSAVTLKDEDHLAAVLMGVHADGCSRDEATLENAVCAVKEHVCREPLFAALEIRKDSHVHLIEINDHISCV